MKLNRYARLKIDRIVGTSLQCHTYIRVKMLALGNLSISLNVQRDIAAYEMNKNKIFLYTLIKIVVVFS